MTHTNLLKAKMVLSGERNFIEAIAAVLNCSRATASAKLNGKAPFNQIEIRKLAEKYDMTAEEVMVIFILED